MNQKMWANFVEQGEAHLFNDFEDDGPMWTGSGQREVRKTVKLSTDFEQAPIISLSISVMDAATDAPQRFSLHADNVKSDSFEIVFNTWLNSRFARVWVSWTAYGTKQDDSFWHDL